MGTCFTIVLIGYLAAIWVGGELPGLNGRYYFWSLAKSSSVTLFSILLSAFIVWFFKTKLNKNIPPFFAWAHLILLGVGWGLYYLPAISVELLDKHRDYSFYAERIELWNNISSAGLFALGLSVIAFIAWLTIALIKA